MYLISNLIKNTNQLPNQKKKMLLCSINSIFNIKYIVYTLYILSNLVAFAYLNVLYIKPDGGYILKINMYRKCWLNLVIIEC